MGGALRFSPKTCLAWGAQLAVDVTLRCALARTGEPHPRPADEDGAVLAQARHDKETTYPELINSRRCRLIVVAIETGGRWSEEAVEFIRLLACAKAQEVPSHMWWPTTLAWQRHWTRMLSTACSLSFAASWWNLRTVAPRGAGHVVRHEFHHFFRKKKRPQERERRMKIVAGGGEKKSEILGGPAQGCPVEGSPEGGSSGSPSEMWWGFRVQFSEERDE